MSGKHSFRQFIILVSIFFLVVCCSSAKSDNEASNAYNYNKTCHESLEGSQVVVNMETKNSGCLLKCTIIGSSTDTYSGYFDQSSVKIHRLSNLPCQDQEHICLNGTCVQNPLLHLNSGSDDPSAGQKPRPTPSTRIYGSLAIKIHGGTFKHDDILSKGDIYIKLFVGDREIGRTPTAHNTYNPKFNKQFNINSLSRHDVLKFEVWDDDDVQGQEYLSSIVTTCNEVKMKRINNKPRSFYRPSQSDVEFRLLLTINCIGF